MRIRLFFLLLFATAFSAAAQITTSLNRQVPYPRVFYSTSQPAEIHFTDGNVANYPILRIYKDLLRVDTGGDQSFRMPLTYVESIKFNNGCTLFFDNGQFQLDRLVQPAFLKNESGDVLLQGVFQLSTDQAAALMGSETYGEYRKNNMVMQVGIGTMTAGVVMVLPYFGKAVADTFQGGSPIQAFKDSSPVLKGITIGGGCVLIAGAVIAIIGNSGCNRVVASYNDGLGVAYTF